MSPRFIALCVLAALGLVPACLHNRAAAQDDDALWLARICVHESGWDSPDDCAGIYAVLDGIRTRHGWSFLTALRSYSPRFLAGTSAHPWARELRDADEAPPHLEASWRTPRAEGHLSRHDAFSALLLRCRALVAAPTAVRADDWGNSRDMARATRLGRHYRVVSFGHTRNVFSVRVRR